MKYKQQMIPAEVFP